jgi:hypothetical protein
MSAPLDENKGGGLGTGAIIGLTVGIIALVGVLGLVVFLYLRRKKSEGQDIFGQRGMSKASLLAELSASVMERSSDGAIPQYPAKGDTGSDDEELWM